MSFQAYINNIKVKTGKTPDDFRDLAEKKGLLKPGVKATMRTPSCRTLLATVIDSSIAS